MRTWRTSDMAMAAYLRTVGYEQLRMELEETLPPSVYWVFRETPRLVSAANDYVNGRSSVEPKGFNSLMALMKNEMFFFLRGQGVKVEPRSRR